MFLINPGSEIGKQEVGFTNTHDVAKRNAYEWFYKPMQEQGFKHVEVKDTGEERDGRWLFIFKHTITGIEVELEIHGIDNMDAYTDKYIFSPRVYWNGSSSGNPELENFARDGYKAVMTYEETK